MGSGSVGSASKAKGSAKGSKVLARLSLRVGLSVCLSLGLSLNLGLGLFGAHPAAAASRPSPLIWHETCGMKAEARKQIERNMLLLAQAYRGLFGYRFGSDFRMQIRYFCSHQDFLDFLDGAMPDDVAMGIAGLFIPEHQMLLINAELSEDAESTLLHETSHALLDSRPGNYLPWLHEGLAETFEYLDRRSPSLRLLPNEYAAHGLRLLVKHQPGLLNLTRYLSLDRTAWRQLDRNYRVGGTAINLSRSIAWGLSTFLISTPRGRGVLRQVIANNQAVRPLSDYELLQRSWPGGVKGLQNEWLRWLLQSRTVVELPEIRMGS